MRQEVKWEGNGFLPQTSRIPHKTCITAIALPMSATAESAHQARFWGLCSKFGNSLADATHRGVPVSASQPRRVASDRHCGRIPGDDVYEVSLVCELFWLQPLASFDWERASSTSASRRAAETSVHTSWRPRFWPRRTNLCHVWPPGRKRPPLHGNLPPLQC